MTYNSDKFEYSMDVYRTFEDIKNNPFNFIVGNGGLGKSTYLKQVQELLKNEHIPCLLIELKTLSDEIPLYNKINNFCVENKNEPFYLLLQKIKELNDIDRQIKDTLALYNENNDLSKTISHIFPILI